MDRETAKDLVQNLTGRPQWPRGKTADEVVREVVALANIQRAEALDLRGLFLSSVPTELAECTSLVSLNLGNNQLESIPAEVFHLPLLRRLYLQGNKLRQIPPQIESLTRLEAIYAQKNQISHVSEKIRALTALKVLDLTENLLVSIPESVGHLRLLEQLYLGRNRIELLPDTFGGLECLRHLDISENALADLPGNFGLLAALETLNLESNRIRTLPPSVSRLSHIEHVWIDGNPLAPEFEYLNGPQGFNGIAPSRKVARRLYGVPDRIREYGVPAIPAPKPGPRFVLNEGPRIELDAASRRDEIEQISDLLKLLAEALEDLVGVTSGSNQFQLIHRCAERYFAAFEADGSASIDKCFTYGLRLSNAYYQIRKEIESEGLPECPPKISEVLDTVLSLHGVIIAATERGRQLLELSRDYRDEDGGGELTVALRNFAEKISARADLFGPLTRETMEVASSHINHGEHGDRSTSEAVRTTFNLMTTVGKTVILVGSVVTSEAVVASHAGAQAIGGLSAYVDLLWNFVTLNKDLIVQVALACGPEFHWVVSLLDWMARRRP